MTTSLYGTSYSSIYAKELKNIRAEQEVEEERLEAKKEQQKVIGAGGMSVAAYAGKAAKHLASEKLEEAAQFVFADKGVQSIKKYEGIAGQSSEIFGDVGKSLFEGVEKYTGLSFSGETVQLTPEYIKAGIESGKGISLAELGFDKVFEKGAEIGTKSAILTAEGTKIGMATLQEGGGVATKLTEKGIEEGVKSSATASAGSIAGKAVAGLGIATGGYQAISGFQEEDYTSAVAGTAKAVGSAMLLSPPLAPVGLVLTGVGTLLDFV
jgi:hypothetical protein|tara:strand:- start:258 stop:1058 length:801 start_codon:yes stop_codon:yes gene_type:complete